MTQTISVDINTIKLILQRLDDLAQDVAEIKKKVSEKEPPYGSQAWWDWSDKKAKEDIKKGRYTMVRDKNELQTHLDSLKRS